MTLVDSSSWIEALREDGDPAVHERIERLLDGGEAAWCPIVRLELWRGVRGGAERRSLLFLEPRVTSLDISAEIWDKSVQLMAKARSRGLTAPVADVLIVSTAVHHGVSLEHCDRHIRELLTLQ